MYKKNFKIVAADKKKLYAALKEAGTSHAGISEELGHEKSYISNCFSKNNGIPEAVAKFLQKYYGIMYDTYKPEDPPKQPEPQAKAEGAVNTAVNEETLLNALKRALDSYAWQETIARTVRFCLREEATEDMINRIVTEAVKNALE